MKLYTHRIECFEYDKKIDVYAYAMILYEIITGHIPWSKETTDAKEIQNLIVQGISKIKLFYSRNETSNS